MSYGDVIAGNACMLQCSARSTISVDLFSVIHLLICAACREGHPLVHLRPRQLGKLGYSNPTTIADAMNLLIYSIERAVSMMSVGVTKVGVIGNVIDVVR